MARIDKALEYLDSLEPEECFEYQEVADRFVVVRSTLTRRHQGISASHKDRNQQQRKLTPHEEAELVQYIEQLSEHIQSICIAMNKAVNNPHLRESRRILGPLAPANSSSVKVQTK